MLLHTQKQQESLSPNEKARISNKDADAHRKQQEALSPPKKLKFQKIMMLHTKNKMNCFPPRKRQDLWKPRLNNIMNI
jgi:hypothetical protein